MEEQPRRGRRAVFYSLAGLQGRQILPKISIGCGTVFFFPVRSAAASQEASHVGERGTPGRSLEMLSGGPGSAPRPTSVRADPAPPRLPTETRVSAL